MHKPLNFWMRSTLAGTVLMAAACFLTGASQGNAVPDPLTSAVIAYQQGNYDLAVAEFSASIRLGETEAYFGRAQAYFKKGDYDQAIADLDNVIQMQNDSSPAALELRGKAFLKKAAYQSAVLDFSRLIVLRPGDAELYVHRADAWFYAGKASQAFADYSQAIKLNTTNAMAFAHRGELYATYKHDYRRGIVDCLSGISLDSNCWLAYNNLAALLSVCPSAKFRDGQLALIHARRACELTYWRNPLPISVLAAAFAETHDFADAIKYQQQSMDLDLDLGPEGTPLALSAEKKLELYQNHRPFHASSH